MLWIIFLSLLVMVNSRPQTSTSSPPPTTDVEIQKHEVVEILNSQPFKSESSREIEESTKEILRKIDQVNRQQNLNKPTKYPVINHGNYRTGQDFKTEKSPETPLPTGNPDEQFVKRVFQQQMIVTPFVPLQFYQNYPDYPENYRQAERTVDNVRNIVEGYYPYAYGYNQNLQRQQWQWPFGQYFPIIIKDPLAQAINAFTSWIEYGPQAGQGVCNQKPPKKSVQNPKSLTENDENPAGFIEDLKITENVNYKTNREAKELTENSTSRQQKLKQVPPEKAEEIRKTLILNSSNPGTRPLNYPLIQSLEITKEQIHGDQQNRSPNSPENDDNIEDEKAENLHVANEGNKKLFSKDNTGSGIFIHKIKVRKGGVAIAGPGGIATAGSGGTAIVGPNGFAYTQPNSLAIAGSGSKVVAVEPGIDLNELISNSTEINGDKKKKRPGQPPRFGKVVAIGPVIYYNQG